MRRFFVHIMRYVLARSARLQGHNPVGFVESQTEFEKMQTSYLRYQGCPTNRSHHRWSPAYDSYPQWWDRTRQRSGSG